MLSFFETKFDFEKKKGGANEKRTTVNITRPNPSSNARVMIALKGFDVSFHGEDHHLLRFFVRPEVDDFGPFVSTVSIKTVIGMRDSSGSWDDEYKGNVTLGIIVIDDDRFEVFEGQRTLPYKSGSGPRSEIDYLQLNRASQQGVVFLQGFDIGYEQKDHHVLTMGAGVDGQVIQVFDQRFDAVQCRLGLRDSSNFWDDPYGGTVYYTSLRFPEELVGFDDGRQSGSHKDEGPKNTTSEHWVQGEIQSDSLFVGMKSFNLAYTGGDHHVHRLVAGVGMENVDPSEHKTKVTIGCMGGVRDKSGEWDDEYGFETDYAVLAVPSQVPAPLDYFTPYDVERLFFRRFQTANWLRR